MILGGGAAGVVAYYFYPAPKGVAGRTSAAPKTLGHKKACSFCNVIQIEVIHSPQTGDVVKKEFVDVKNKRLLAIPTESLALIILRQYRPWLGEHSGHGFIREKLVTVE